MQPVTRSLLTLPMLSRNAKSVSSALLSLQMRTVLLNLTSNKCGKVLTVLLETFLMEPCSESQSLFLTFQDWFQGGPSQLLSEDMLMEINTGVRITLLTRLESASLFSLQKMVVRLLDRKFINLRVKVPIWVCTILRLLLNLLPEPVCNTL